MRNARASRPIGKGHTSAFHSWLLDNHLNLPTTDCSRLLAVMEIVQDVERWRMTLPEAKRRRLNHPSAVLRNYRKAMVIKPTPVRIVQPAALPPAA